MSLSVLIIYIYLSLSKDTFFLSFSASVYLSRESLDLGDGNHDEKRMMTEYLRPYEFSYDCKLARRSPELMRLRESSLSASLCLFALIPFRLRLSINTN
uniref:Uncharacterized protein n=1 Tax=Utricularia reniformis TaxID=192314 RepID=A0A1Y0B1A7_9LAMI|nr:hypothetical protein AEK19_MT1013 [Utricularia reniformis]ART31235.1 hypothetical protein AEK19_MT1013 [Utricularia reniformis]